jgi:phage terminase small subunit
MKASWIKFADHYIQSNNATNAYKAAYPNCKTDATAWTNGSLLLRNTKIAKYIEEKRTELQKKDIIKKEDILKDLKYIVTMNITERPAVAIKAYDLAVKMLGYASPIESMVTLKGEQPLFLPLNDNDNEKDNN